MTALILAFEADAVGRTCRVQRRESDWNFDLQDGRGIAVGCHWRIVSPDRIAVTDEDDTQWFGLPEPVDAEARANALVSSATIVSVRVDRTTADLCLWFSNGMRLDLVNNSCGYEGWEARFVTQGQKHSVIALGGGDLAFT